MMRIFTFSMLAVLLSFSAAGQAFQKCIDINSGDDYANQAVPDGNGGHFLVGSTSAPGAGGYDAFITHVDPMGNVLWQKQYGGSATDYGTSLMPTTDGNLLLVGRSNSYGSSFDVFAVKVDMMGNVIWSNTYGTDSVDLGFRAAEGPNGYMLVGQTHGSPAPNDVRLDGFMVYIRPDGSLVWSRGVGTPFSNEVAYDVLYIGDLPGWIVTGYSGVNIFGLNEMSLLAVDTNGNYMMGALTGGSSDDDSRRFVPSSNQIFLVGNTASYGAGGNDICVVRLDFDPNFLHVGWAKAYGGTGSESFTSAHPSPDGAAVVITGYTQSFGQGGDGFVFVIDTAQGNVLMQKAYGSTGNDFVMDASVSNMGATFVGYSDNYGDHPNNIYLIRPDSNLATLCGITDINLTVTPGPDSLLGPVLSDFGAVIISATSTAVSASGTSNVDSVTTICIGDPVSVVELQGAAFGMNLFPNPASTHSTLSFAGDHLEAIVVEVYDATGRLLQQVRGIHGSSYTLSTAQLAPGTYQVVASTAGHRALKQLVVY